VEVDVKDLKYAVVDDRTRLADHSLGIEELHVAAGGCAVGKLVGVEVPSYTYGLGIVDMGASTLVMGAPMNMLEAFDMHMVDLDDLEKLEDVVPDVEVAYMGYVA
jgi:hypothetical protein